MDFDPSNTSELIDAKLSSGSCCTITISLIRQRRIPLRLAVICAAFVGVSCARAPSPSSSLEFTVSEETTFITEPLLADGRPDYAGALNEMYGQAVTSETNAAVPLALVLGWELPDEVAESTGIDGETLESAPRFVGGIVEFHEYLAWREREGRPPPTASSDELSTALSDAIRAPWTASEHPAIAEWLTDMEGALAAIDEASHRLHFFIPFNKEIYVEYPVSLLKLRNVANSFRARANFRVGQEDFAGAAQDLMTVVRFSARLGQRATNINLLVAYALAGIGYEGLGQLVTTAPLSPTLLREVLATLETNKPRPLAEAVHYYERFVVLELLTPTLEDDTGFTIRSSAEVDLDRVLRFVNRAYDLTVACMKADTVESVRRACSERDAFIDGTQPLDDDEAGRILRSIGNGDELSPEDVARAPKAFVSGLRVLGAQKAENHVNVIGHLAATAIRLALREAERGSFPATVEGGARGYRLRLHSSASAYAYTATPHEPGLTGRGSFCLDSKGSYVTRNDGLEPDVLDERCVR